MFCLSRTVSLLVFVVKILAIVNSLYAGGNLKTSKYIKGVDRPAVPFRRLSGDICQAVDSRNIVKVYDNGGRPLQYVNRMTKIPYFDESKHSPVEFSCSNGPDDELRNGWQFYSLFFAYFYFFLTIKSTWSCRIVWLHFRCFLSCGRDGRNVAGSRLGQFDRG